MTEPDVTSDAPSEDVVEADAPTPAPEARQHAPQLDAEAIVNVEQGPEAEPMPEQTDNRAREEDGPQLPADVAEGAAPLPDDLA